MVGVVGGTILLGSIATGTWSLGLAWYLDRYRGTAGATWIMAYLVAQAVWAFSYAAGLELTSTFWRAAAEALVWIAMNWTGPLFLGFALRYTGRSGSVRSRWTPVMFLPGILTTGLGLTHPFHDLLWSGFRVAPVFGLSTVRYAIQPLGYATVVASLAMAGVGVLLFAETVLSYGPLYRREAIAVFCSPFPAAVALLVWLAGIGPVPALNLTPVLMLFHVALDTYAFVGTHMFETNPATQRAAERSALDDLEDPLFVVDPQERIVNLNRQATELVETRLDDLPLPFADVLGTTLDEARTSGEITGRSLGRTVYAVSHTPLSDPTGDHVGAIVVLYDISDQRQREQQLSVLNRILRHNLRNELTVIDGHASVIQSRSSESGIEEQAGTIAEASDRLLSITRKAREFERLQNREFQVSTVETETVLDRVAGAVRDDYPSATVETSVGPAATALRTDVEVLSLALRNLVDNAIRHASTARPEGSVRVSASEDPDGSFIFEVRDDNDRIPEMETAALEANEESPLKHGQGIGLWIVNWCVTTLNGDLAFEYDGGNVVTIRLPQHQEPPADGDTVEDRTAR